MKRNEHGFTLVEIVVVLVWISIIAGTVITRSITSDQIHISAQTEIIKKHIRYAQSLAMSVTKSGVFSAAAVSIGFLVHGRHWEMNLTRFNCPVKTPIKYHCPISALI